MSSIDTDYVERLDSSYSIDNDAVIRQIVDDAPHAVFTCEYLNRHDDEHEMMLGLAEALKERFGIKTILIGMNEYECMSDDIDVFDPEGVIDIKYSVDMQPKICGAVLDRKAGPVLSCSRDMLADLGKRIQKITDEDEVWKILEELSDSRPAGNKTAEKKKGGVREAIRQSAFMQKNNRYQRLTLKWRSFRKRKTDPLVSIIVPFYNNNGTVCDALDSIRKNGYENYEVILINDGSEQDPRDIIRKYKKVRYIYKENGGLGDTRNKGIDEALGKYVFFLDSDDTIVLGGLAALVDCAEKNKLEVAAGRTRRLEKSSGKSVYWRRRLYSKSCINERARRQLMIEDTLATAKLYRTDFLREGGHRFDKGLYEDMPFIADIYLQADRIGIVSRTVQNWIIYGVGTTITTRTDVDNVFERIRRLDQVFERQTEALKVYYTCQFINRQMKYSVNSFRILDNEDRRRIYDELRRAMQMREKYIRSSMLPVYSREKMAQALLDDDYNEFEKLALSYSDRYFTEREELQQDGDPAETVK